MRPLKLIEVVAAVIETDGKILCVQRGANAFSYLSGKWEFPGGKIEPGEDHSSSLSREIAEELHASVHVGAHLTTVDHIYDDFRVTMYAYRCSLAGPPSSVALTEHVALRWLKPTDGEFARLDWAAADIPIVELLRPGRQA